MFSLLKELTKSKSPEKVLIREEGSSPITKYVNVISLIRIENDKGTESDMVVDKSAVEPIKLVDKEEAMDEKEDDEPNESMNKDSTRWRKYADILLEIPRSQLIGYYLKHEINEKIIKGLVDNHKYNNSLLATCLGKMDNETYNSLPIGPMYNVILKSKLATKDERGAEESILIVMQTLEEKQIDKESMQELLLQFFKDLPTLESIDETPPSDAITPDLPITDSLVMEDEHLDTILETDSDEEIESSVENLNLTPSESEDLSDYVNECDLPFCDNSPDFNNDSEIFSNPLFDSNVDYTSSDDESSSEEDVPLENFKIYSNPLLKFDEEIFSSEINPLYNEVLEDLDSIPSGNENDHFNAESDLIESLLNKDTVITFPKIDFLLEEFAGEPTLINPIPPGIAETNFDPKESIHLIKKLLYDNSSPRPPEVLNSENDFEKENSGSTTIHTYISLPEYESFDDESDSASEIFNDDLAHIISPSEYEYVYADDESDSGDLTTDVVEDISGDSTRKLQISHRGFKALKISHNFFNKIPMMIYGGDIPILDVPYLHFYHP
ncbi:hypothetical protein Tco_0481050 [Tanacetum coccineum]